MGLGGAAEGKIAQAILGRPSARSSVGGAAPHAKQRAATPKAERAYSPSRAEARPSFDRSKAEVETQSDFGVAARSVACPECAEGARWRSRRRRKARESGQTGVQPVRLGSAHPSAPREASPRRWPFCRAARPACEGFGDMPRGHAPGAHVFGEVSPDRVCIACLQNVYNL